MATVFSLRTSVHDVSITTHPAARQESRFGSSGQGYWDMTTAVQMVYSASLGRRFGERGNLRVLGT